MTTASSANILTSLPALDEARRTVKSSEIVTHEESHLVEYPVLTDESEEETTLTPVCHLSVLNAFTQRTWFPSQPAFEDTAVVALAAHHLNTGDGSIVPELEGFDCKVKFTTEFSDTRLSAATAMSHVVQQVHRDADDEENRIPCAFVGAYASSSSIPSSMASGVLGYPQVSGTSSSAQLDDTSQHPLFGRTVPSDQGNTIPTILYMRQRLNITHLAILNDNNGYGNAYAEAMRLAAQEYAPDMIIHQIPMDEQNEETEDNGAIQAAVTSLKNSQFRFMTTPTQDALMLEAYRQGVAGTGDIIGCGVVSFPQR
jgi:Receptor family ligand binding region